MRRFSLIQLVFLLALTIFVGVGDLFGQTCPDGMISYWRMQETSGPTYVDHHGSNDAFAPEYAPSVVSGISGNGQSFNKSTKNYVTIPDNAAFDWGGGSSFSIELWVKYTATGATQVFMGRDESSSLMQWWIGADVSGKISWFIQSSDGSNGMVNSGISYGNGEWHHVVAVRDGTAGRNWLYVDGVLQNAGGTPVILPGTLSSSKAISLGTLLYNGVPDYYLTGSMDEVAIYNRVLDLALDITPHFNNLRLFQIGYCDGDYPLIISKENVEAQVGQVYLYDVDASGNSLPEYELIEGPDDMKIDKTSGLITWTPLNISQNGHVVVRATNDKGSVDQEFNVFIADTPSCRSNLIAYWDFNDANSAPYYDNISNWELTGVGPVPTTGIGGKGKALLFDGKNDSLNMIDDFAPSRIWFDFDDVTNWSMEAWVKSDATPAQTMVIVGRDQVGLQTQYWLGIHTDGSAGFYLRDWPDEGNSQYLEGGVGILDGNWHHIVGSYSDAAQLMKLYVDGEMVASVEENFFNFWRNAKLNIGCLDAGSNKYWFDGVIDEFAVYDQQLSTARVQENYTNGMSGLGACVYNHAPVISSKPLTVIEQEEDYEYEIIVEELDVLDNITISAPTKPEWLTFNYTAGDKFATLTGKPGQAEVGQVNSVLLRAFDGKVSVDQEFQIEVRNVNDAPEITSVPITEILQNETYIYTVVATDGDDDELVYSVPVKPATFSFDPATQILTGVPSNDDVGTVDITVSVFDGLVTIDQSFQITVIDVNDAPVITSNPITEIFQGENYSYTMIANDPDDDVLVYSAITIPNNWMTFDVNTHRLSGTIDDFEGVVDITLRVSDGTVDVDQTFQLNVLNVNDLPEFSTDPITTATVGEPYLYQLEATDSDAGDVLTFTAQTIPDWLSFVPASNSALLTGTPEAGDAGSHMVIIKVSDGHGDVLQAFSINVIITAIEDNVSLINQVYPNPVENEVHFELSTVGDIVMVLYDITGTMVMEKSVQNSDHFQVDLTGLPSNLYFYKISMDNELSIGKLIKK